MVKLYSLCLIFFICFNSKVLSQTSECPNLPLWPAIWDNRTTDDFKDAGKILNVGPIREWFWVNSSFVKIDFTFDMEDCNNELVAVNINSKNCEKLMNVSDVRLLKPQDFSSKCLCDIPPSLQTFYRLAVVYKGNLSCNFNIEFRSGSGGAVRLQLFMFEEELDAHSKGEEAIYPPRPTPVVITTTPTSLPNTLNGSKTTAIISSNSGTTPQPDNGIPIWPFIVAGIILLLIIMGIGGYFLYRYYKKSKSKTPGTSGTPNPTNDSILKPEETTKTTTTTAKVLSSKKPGSSKLLEPSKKPSTLALQTTQTVNSVNFNSGDVNAPRDERFPQFIPGTVEFMAASSGAPESKQHRSGPIDDSAAAEFVNSH